MNQADYQKKLDATKTHYPFGRWQKSSLPQYTPTACAAFAAIFDQLIANLANLGEAEPADQKLELFREAVVALNTLNETDDSLIETGEREALCELCNVVAVAAGLNPEEYGDGEGPASKWRDW